MSRNEEDLRRTGFSRRWHRREMSHSAGLQLLDDRRACVKSRARGSELVTGMCMVDRWQWLMAMVNIGDDNYHELP